jgi:hypothetical protein
MIHLAEIKGPVIVYTLTGDFFFGEVFFTTFAPLAANFLAGDFFGDGFLATFLAGFAGVANIVKLRLMGF